MKKSILITASALALLAGPAAAQQFTQEQLDWLNENYVPKSEMKTKYTRSGDKGVRLKLSGQINRGILFVDDGFDNETYFVDNDNSSTRFRITGSGDLGETEVGINFEVQIESNSTADVNILDGSVNSGGFSERKLEFYAKGAWGKLSLGQGDMASNGTSEEDLSGTGVVGYSAVHDLGGGQLFRDTAALPVLGVNPQVGDVFNNFDGQSRRDRIRYDTPTLAGFTLSSSFGEDDRWDVALRYANEFGGIRVAAAVAHGEDDGDDKITNGSISALHTGSGVSLTLAAGQQDLSAVTTQDPQFYYAKLGWQTKAISPLGKTAFAVDYYDGDDIDAIGGESSSWGIMGVQKLDKIGTELYLGVRNYEYEEPAMPFQDITAVLAGARVKF